MRQDECDRRPQNDGTVVWRLNARMRTFGRLTALNCENPGTSVLKYDAKARMQPASGAVRSMILKGL